MQTARANNRCLILVSFFIALIFYGGPFCPFLLSADNSHLAQLLDESERQARKVSDKEDRFLLLDNIALYRATIGQIEEAERLIKELEPEFVWAPV